MVIVYGLRNCDTCRKARRWLEQQGIDYRFVDLRRDGIDGERIGGWAERLGVDALINRRGRTWRELAEAERERDAAGLCDLAAGQPALIKRPVIEHAGGAVSVGWDEAVRTTLGAG